MSAAGLILAAGGGTRFGGAVKQLADLRGRPLLAHALEAQLGALDRVVVVLGHAADEIAAHVDFGRAEVVVAADWAQGQSASLKAGIGAISEDRAVITLGDQPFISPELITAALAQLTPEYDAVRAFYDGKPGHPVVFSRAVMDGVHAIDGDKGARELLKDFRVNRWDATHLGDATDVDTQEELSGICGGSVPPLIGGVLTGTGLTLGQAAQRLQDGEPLPALTPVQRRLVEASAERAALGRGERA
jgi:molybdenum cofactor cytidylyltransferase